MEVKSYQYGSIPNEILEFKPNTDFMSLEEQRSFGGNLVKTYQCHETLLDAMKSQLEANKKLVNEIIAKAEAFDKEYKPVTKKTKP